MLFKAIRPDEIIKKVNANKVEKKTDTKIERTGRRTKQRD